LEFEASALADPLFDKVTVSAAGDFSGVSEMEEDIFDGLFG